MTPTKQPSVLPSAADAVLTIVAVDARGSVIAQGSGFILNADGLAGSNYHVLRGAAGAVARCCNGRSFEIGEIEGVDFNKDLIIFQLHESKSGNKPNALPYLILAPSTEEVSVGEKVIAIGSPRGLENSISDGIVAAVREYETVRYLQITAPVSPGSSGGPVLNTNGQMIGVATFQLEIGQNLNFAIAAKYIRPLLDQHFQVPLSEFQSIVRQSRSQRRNVAARDQTASATRKPLAGQFSGIVHNTSVDISSGFGLLVREDDGALSGCMLVTQPLFGSGPLVGFASNSDVFFAVTSAIGTIDFVGKRRGATINGSYTVHQGNGTTEDGTFTLRRVKGESLTRDFDTAKCPTDAEVNQ